MEDKLLTLTKKLIEIESTKENPKNLGRVLDVALGELKDFKVKKFNKNKVSSLLFYNPPNIPRKFKIILNAHLDVVPAKKEQYKLKILGDKAFGRGTNDMKAAVAAMILLFKELTKKVKYPLGLQLVTDEEIGGFNGTKYQIEKGVKADFVIAGEPTNFGVNNKAKGIVWAKVKAKGKSAHGAYPWDGVNAVSVLNEYLNRLWKAYPIPTKESWKTTINVGRVITTNETFNKVPEYAEAWLDIRYIPEESESIVDNLKKLLPKNIELDIQLKEPPQFTDESNKYLKLLKNSIEKIIDKKPEVIVKHGGSDIRHYNQVGCNGVTFGPIGAGLHTDNEWVHIKSLTDYYEILKNFLLSIN